MTRLSELPAGQPSNDDLIYVVSEGESRRARIGDLPASDAIIAAIEAAGHVHANAGVLSATTASFLHEDRSKLDGIEPGAQVNFDGLALLACIDAALSDAGWRAPPPVVSVNGLVGAVNLGPSELGCATAADGAVARTAVQPSALAPVAFSGLYADLAEAPTLPTATGSLANTGAGGPDERYVCGQSGGITRIRRLARTEYEALASPDPETLYVLEG